MAQNYNDIIKGYRIPAQIRLDAKSSVLNENVLKNLGPGDNLAYTYYEGLQIYCKEEKKTYVWREVVESEIGLLPTNFIYPVYAPVDNIDYSNRVFNFFNTEVIIPDVETKINAGLNISVVGNGSTLTPYVISTPTIVIPVVDGSETKLISGTNTTVSGNGTTLSPYQISVPTPPTPIIPDGSETKLNVLTGLSITGTGTTATPYSIGTDNLQKVITSSTYTIVNEDNNYTIFIDNGVTPVIITVPLNLNAKIGVGFIQKGTADVSFITTGGAILNNPKGFKIKGKDYCVFIEKELNTANYYLLGNTKS